jgi:type II secretory pathway predicted ATPase ExeA
MNQRGILWEKNMKKFWRVKLFPDDLTDLRLNVVEGLKNLFETNTQRNAFILSAIGTKMLTGDMSQSQLEQMKKMLAKRADILSKETE